MLRKFFLAGMLLFTGLPGFAKQWVIIYAEKISRTALAGHAFVSFIQEDPFSKMTRLVGCWGFYPRIKTGNAVWGTVPAELRDDWKTNRDYSFLVEVSQEEFNHCLRIKSLYQKKLEYTLTGQSCVTFVRDILNALKKVKQPEENIQLPQNVVLAVIEQNKQLQKKSEESFLNSMSNLSNDRMSEAILPETPNSKSVKSNPETTSLDEGKLIGGTTPEELGKLIFKAVKTNDKNLYRALIHPDPNNNDIPRIEKNLQILRETFPQRGLTEWNLMKFSRVKFEKDIRGWTDDNGTNSGEQVRRAFQVEFTYKNDFIGSIGTMTIVTYKGKYFIYSGGGRASLERF